VSSAGPRILAVLATHDGAPMLRRTLTAVAAQTQPGIEVFAVDNASTDGSGELLIDVVGPDRVILSDRDLGLPAAIDLALDAVDAEDARRGRPVGGEDDLVLILHDDLELERDAVERLVEALADDPRVAIVGPKLRWADDPMLLQSVGATIDLTGRVDDGIDPGEIDQGQRDGDRRVLFVPTAGMLLRRRVFDELGRFDRRAYAFREDLDLCWRAAIAGHDVEVVPGAVARHAALSAEHRRPGRVADLGPRFLAERNTLAAILTNYGPERLVYVVPLALLVGIAKVAGFLLTRRFGDARATVAAWGWNLVNLRGTLHRRRVTQRLRRRGDADIAPLFGRVTPRLQAYLEAVLDRIVGDAAPGDLGSAENQPSATLQGELDRRPFPGTAEALTAEVDDALAEEALADVELADRAPVDEVLAERARSGEVSDLVRAARPVERGRLRRLLTALRTRAAARPLQVLLPPTLLLLLVGLRDVLLPGTVRGGDLVPFPTGPSLIARHLATWHDSGAALSRLDPSPAQLVLGALQAVGGDSALRLLLLLAPLLAWILAARALRSVVAEGLPRTLLGLAYAASPPVLAALAGGDVVTLIVALVLPLLALAGMTIFDASAPVERVWRRLAMSAFLLATLIAFMPPLVVVLPLIAAAGVGHALIAVEDARWRRTLSVRSIVVALLPLPLLGPWLLGLPDVLRQAWAVPARALGGHPALWVLLDPTTRIAGIAGVALVVAGIAGALVVTVADVGPTTLRSAVAMVATGLVLPLVAWWLDAAGTSVRPGPLLVVAAAALVGVAAVGLSHTPSVLSRHPFGWRQVGVALVAAGTVTLTGAGLLHLAVDGTPGLARSEAVPAYLATLAPYPADRILVLGVAGDELVWEVVPATGPDLAAFGVRHDPALHPAIVAAVADLLAGSDPRAAARLGRLGIGVVLVPAGLEDSRLSSLLRVQSALDPLPALVGSVSRVSGGLPGAAVVRDVVSFDRVPDPTTPPRRVVAAVRPDGPDRLQGDAGPGGELLAALPFGAGWRVLVDGAALPMLSDDGLIRVRDVPAGADVEVVATASARRGLLLRGQALWAVLVLSFGARPPTAAVRNAREREEVEA
jgi:GT2 family glycosyltransferase